MTPETISKVNTLRVGMNNYEHYWTRTDGNCNACEPRCKLHKWAEAVFISSLCDINHNSLAIYSKHLIQSKGQELPLGD